jgi:4'-phosphopantetheinyl transferase
MRRPRHADLVVCGLDVAPGTAQRLLGLLSAQERATAARFALERDRRRFYVARARLRELLAERLDTAPAELELTRGAHGKPALGGRFARSSLRFNATHCGDLALFAFAAGREVGVDIEAVRPVPEAHAIAERFFSPREARHFFALPAREQPLAFFSCWTRKEAFAKALGSGLLQPPESLDVFIDPAGWRLESFAPLPGFVAALAVEAP